MQKTGNAEEISTKDRTLQGPIGTFLLPQSARDLRSLAMRVTIYFNILLSSQNLYEI